MESNFYGMPGMSPMNGFYPNGQRIMHHEAMIVPSEGIPMHDSYDSRMHQLQTMSSESLNSFSDLEDPSRTTIHPQGGTRGKKRSVPGPDHVKHRRTRSGCYTCRQRRVKVGMAIHLI